jgi:hypothetical protein
VDDGDSSDKTLPMAKVWTQVDYEIMRSSSKWWRAGGAKMVNGDGDLIGEVAAAEEVLMPEAIALGSSMKLVLDEGEVTPERIPRRGHRRRFAAHGFTTTPRSFHRL